MPAREIIDGVLELVAGLDARGTRALDVSCRNGEVMTALAARGFEVRGTRFERGLPPIEGMPIDEGVDLTRGLPYPDESFDLVVLTEVIEHLENHRAALGEVARVLRPGGHLILTTPNIMRLDSRLGFMLSGMHKAKRRQIPLDTPLDKAHHFHNYPIPFVLLYYLMVSMACGSNGSATAKSSRSATCSTRCFTRWSRSNAAAPDMARAQAAGARAQPGACALDARPARADGRQPDRARAQGTRSGNSRNSDGGSSTAAAHEGRFGPRLGA